MKLEYDPGNAHLGHKDKYGRTLAYVFLPGGTFLNAEIIRRGYGFAYTRFPFRQLEEFRRYEREAWEARRGLWGRVRRRSDRRGPAWRGVGRSPTVTLA